MSFANLPEDVLIYLLSFLSVPEILCVRQTCKLLNETTNLAIVWINACEIHVRRNRYPFPVLNGEDRGKSSTNIHDISRPELEYRTRHAYRLGRKWSDLRHLIKEPLPPLIPLRDIDWVVSPSTPIADVRFVRSVRRASSSSTLGLDESVLVLSVSKGIWSVITIWNVLLSLHETNNTESRPQKCAEWSLKGGLFTGLCLSHENSSEADLAMSVVCEGRHEIDLFTISDDGELLRICTIPSVPIRIDLGLNSEEDSRRLRAMQPMKPMALAGHILAMSDDTASTIIYNWKTSAFAVLEHEEDQVGVWKQDHIIQVVFAYKSILVVRARSLHLFPEPELELLPPLSSVDHVGGSPTPKGLPVYTPIASHSFGWVDGVSVIPIYSDASGCSQPVTLRILVRLQSDDPWIANEHSLDLYELSLNPSAIQHYEQQVEDALPSTPQSPYLFPPICTARVTSTRGSLRCTDLILGKCGTAIWVKPGERASYGLLTSDVYDDYYIAGLRGIATTAGDIDGRASESLVAGTFPGSLNPDNEVRTRKICTNVLNNWTALDYDEAIGRVVLGDATGNVRILQL